MCCSSNSTNPRRYVLVLAQGRLQAASPFRTNDSFTKKFVVVSEKVIPMFLQFSLFVLDHILRDIHVVVWVTKLRAKKMGEEEKKRKRCT